MVTQQPTATRWTEFQRAGAGVNQRTQALEELRHKMHQFVISELGPILYDQRISEADLRKLRYTAELTGQRLHMERQRAVDALALEPRQAPRFR